MISNLIVVLSSHMSTFFQTSGGASESGSTFWDSFWGTFLGALFAFVFGIIMFVITKIWERFLRHIDALVKIEFLVVEHLDELDLLKPLTTEMINDLRNNKFPLNRFHILKTPESLELEIDSPDVFKRYFSYIRSVSTLNGGLILFNNSLERLDKFATNNTEAPPQNIAVLADKLSEYLYYYDLAIEKSIELLSVIGKNRKEIEERYGGFILKNIIEIIFSDEEIKEEVDRIKEKISSSGNR